MAKGASTLDWHVLDFFCDDSNSSALTVLVRGFRFHIIADKEELPRPSGPGKRYDRLVHKLRANDNDGASSGHETEADSGVDLSNDKRSDRKEKVDPEEALQHFMLEPLVDEFSKLSETKEEESLQEWYNGPTYFYNLRTSSEDKLEAVQLEATPDLTKRMVKLKPEMALPKSLTDQLDVSCDRASELTVTATSDQPPGTPYHPCRVRRNDSEPPVFLKVVDNNQPQPMKRELDLLHRAMELKLNTEINVPALEGLVVFDDVEETKSGQKRIMGFLQTDIPGAQPLTSMLSPSVDQSKRERWADEADYAKRVLHKHEIVWGDAKADNFVVDEEDKLWIIDFGGSYTEGWVDPEMNETIEGDNMGVERIVNALEDPVANTYDPDEDRQDDGGSEGVKQSVTFSPDKEMRLKRKASEVAEAVDEEHPEKARKAR